MFDLLKEYECISFFFTKDDNLRKECTIAGVPNDCCGVYVVYGYKDDKEEVMYIGSSGHLEGDVLKPRENGLRRRIYGKQMGPDKKSIPRQRLWPVLMGDSISKLKVCCYLTANDNPLNVEYFLILEYMLRYHKFPAWNNELKLDRKLNADILKFMKEKDIDLLDLATRL